MWPNWQRILGLNVTIFSIEHKDCIFLMRTAYLKLDPINKVAYVATLSKIVSYHRCGPITEWTMTVSNHCFALKFLWSRKVSY